MKQFGVFGTLLLSLVKYYKKTLPNLDSKNSKRLQFILKFSALILYAWSCKIFAIPTDFYRTPSQQKERFDAGNSQLDGYSKISNHQKWQAGDLLILNSSKLVPIWSYHEDYLKLGLFWEQLGGKWGGRWHTIRDIYHFEIQ